MKKKNFILGLFLGLGLAFLVPQQAQAAPRCGNDYGYSVAGLENEYIQGQVTNISFTVSNVWPGRSYQLLIDPGVWGWNRELGSPKTAVGSNVSFSTSDPDAISINGEGSNKQLFLEWEDGGTKTCLLAEYKIEVGGSCIVTADQAGFLNTNCLDKKSPITFKVSNATWGEEVFTGKVSINNLGPIIQLNESGNGTYIMDNPESLLVNGENWNIKVYKVNTPVWNGLMCETTIGLVQEECTDEQRETLIDQTFELCNQIPESGPRDKCLTCFSQQGIWTAIGCIDTSSTEGIVSKLMTVGISIAGGIALLMILASAFLFATSEGEPKRTSEAKEILTSAIIGLIFIIFSVTILQFIGVNILKIPGFGE